MLGKFWEGVGDKLADRWSATLLAPAFVFWAGGLLALAERSGWNDILQRFDPLTEAEKVAVLVGGLVLVAVSSEVVRSLTLPVLRAVEGYWPRWLWWLRRPFVSWQGFWVARAERRWQELAHTSTYMLTPQERAEYDTLDSSESRWQELWDKSFASLSPQERDEYVALDQRLRQYPADRSHWMPTRLGNILRAAERRPQVRYGLDAIICWPRLWLLLPDGARSELVAARQSLDAAMRLVIWGVLFIVWTTLSWWAALAGLVVILWSYRSALGAAVVYGDLLEAAFDVHRGKLYEALRLPLPTSTDERVQGRLVTQYLFRGPPEAPVALVASQDGS
jgi:hypothetical protein